MAAIMVTGAFGFARPSHATDFTFVVPVDVSNLPSDVVSMLVFCSVYAGGTFLAHGGAPPAPITGGGYHGDVTVAFNAPAGRDPGTATTYECLGYFAGHGSPPPFYFGYTYSATPPTFPLLAGAPFLLDTGAQPLH